MSGATLTVDCEIKCFIKFSIKGRKTSVLTELPTDKPSAIYLTSGSGSSHMTLSWVELGAETLMLRGLPSGRSPSVRNCTDSSVESSSTAQYPEFL